MTYPAADPAHRPTVLFVDDEPHLLSALRRSLTTRAGDWDLAFADSGEAALAVLAERAVDAVVTDMRMPGMNGAQLLAEVQRRQPAAVRIVLSGEAERDAVLAAAALAHQFLAKPCDAETILATVGRALEVQDGLADPALRALIGEATDLPAAPDVYQRLVAVTSSPECSMDVVAGIVAGDVATSMAVLKLTNSAFFAIPRPIASVSQAVTLLGLSTIQSLVLVGSVFRDGDPARGADVDELRQRALRRSRLVRLAARATGYEEAVTGTAELAAMVRDVGALLLAEGRPAAFQQLAKLVHETPELLDDPLAMSRCEREMFGCTVTQASAYLLGLWGFTPQLVHAVGGQPAWVETGVGGELEMLLTIAHQVAVRPGSSAETVLAQLWQEDTPRPAPALWHKARTWAQVCADDVASARPEAVGA